MFPKEWQAFEVGIHSRLLQPQHDLMEFCKTLKRVRVYTKPKAKGRITRCLMDLFKNTSSTLLYGDGLAMKN
jgi:hypothetical protein